MFANIPTWTTERLELLQQHFEAGLSCREIAAHIGVSRNAVIGKLTRLGLTRGPTGAEQHLQATSKERRPRSSPRAQYRMLQVVYENGQPAAADAPIASANPCSLLELSKERCRWPISTPGEEGICFCGNTPLKGLPYCPGHTRLAYKPGSRQRMARA
jgi:GcrA cell cycle regulator